MAEIGIVRVQCRNAEDAKMYAEQFIDNFVPVLSEASSCYPFAALNADTGLLTLDPNDRNEFARTFAMKNNSVEALNKHFADLIIGKFEHCYWKLSKMFRQSTGSDSINSTVVRSLGRMMDLTSCFRNKDSVDVLKDFFADTGEDFIREGGLGYYDAAEEGDDVHTYLVYVYCEY